MTTNEHTNHPGDRQLYYRGHPDGSTVTIEQPGIAYLRPPRLPHHVKHSPTGFSWGYGGSGPAELARCLLIHALGDAARCATCHGTTHVVYDWVADREIPAHEATSEHCDVTDDGRGPRFSDPMRCSDCENGWGVMPSTYQPFKWDVVANLPKRGWTLRRVEILSWLEQHTSQTQH